jgi:hypothetical protein
MILTVKKMIKEATKTTKTNISKSRWSSKAARDTNLLLINFTIQIKSMPIDIKGFLVSGIL